MSYSQYFLIALFVILVGLWGYTWHNQPAARSHQWLSKLLVCALPFGVMTAWLWQWSLPNVSLLPDDWIRLQIALLFSLSVPLIAFWSHKIAGQSFNQPVNLRWIPYLSSLIGLYVISLVSTTWQWSMLSSIAIFFLCIAIFGLFTSRYASIKPQAIAVLVTLLYLLVIGSLAGLVDPTITGITLIGLPLGWSLEAIIALTSVSLAVPILAAVWLNQTLKATD